MSGVVRLSYIRSATRRFSETWIIYLLTHPFFVLLLVSVFPKSTKRLSNSTVRSPNLQVPLNPGLHRTNQEFTATRWACLSPCHPHAVDHVLNIPKRKLRHRDHHGPFVHRTLANTRVATSPATVSHHPRHPKAIPRL